MAKRKTIEDRHLARNDSERHQRSCGSKLRFASKKVLLEHIAMNRPRGLELRGYKCKVCRGFHLTSRPELRRDVTA